MFEFLKSEEVQTALQAAAIGLIGVIALVARNAFETWARQQLLKYGIQYSLNVTSGVDPLLPIPSEKVPEVVRNTKEYMVKANPKRAAAITDVQNKVIARINIAELPPRT